MTPASPDGLAGILHTALGTTGHGTALVLGAGGHDTTPTVARLFAEVLAVEPDPHLAPDAMRLQAPGVQWIQAPAEDVRLDEGEFDAAFLGPSWQWMDRPLIVARLHRALRPGGHVVLISELPVATGTASLPTDEIEAVVSRFSPVAATPARHREDQARRDDVGLLAEAGFVDLRHYVAQDRGLVFWDVETVMAHTYAHTRTAPHLFGYSIVEFDAQLRALLTARATDGGFVLPRPATDVQIWTRP